MPMHSFHATLALLVAPSHAFKGGFSWTRQWYPLAFSKVTDRSVPHRLELLGEPLVLWYDGVHEAWCAMIDACPHRLAPLSEGRIDEKGAIECPYHGWAFEGDGSCTRVPQGVDPLDPILLSKCGGTSYVVAERQGLVWVWGEPLNFSEADPKQLPDESQIPICEALEDDRFVWIDVSRDMPYSADMLLENVLDSSHVPFTHHQTISKRENAKPLPLVLTEMLSAAGFAGENRVDGDAGVLKVQDGSAPPTRRTERTTVFRAPTYMHHKIRSGGLAGTDAEKDFDAGFETWTVAYATPTGPGRCRLFARFPFRFPPPKPRTGLLGKLPSINLPAEVFRRVPTWAQHMGQLKVLDDDNIFLPLQERRVADVGGWKRGYVTPTSADLFVNTYRRWFDAAGTPPHASHAVDYFRGAALDKATLLDRYAQHTKHCTACSGALANAQRISKACTALLLALGTCTPWAIVGSSHAVLGAASALSTARTVPTALAATCGLIGTLLIRPIGAVTLSALALFVIRQFAQSVAEKLTTGLGEYPPPRNRAEGEGAATELRTVEQGRAR